MLVFSISAFHYITATICQPSVCRIYFRFSACYYKPNKFSLILALI